MPQNKITAVIRKAVYIEPDDDTGDGWWDDETVEQRQYASRAAAVRWLRSEIAKRCAAEPNEWYTGTATEYAFDPEFHDFVPVADLDQLNRDELGKPRWYTN